MRKRKLLQLKDEETEVNYQKTEISISVIMRSKCLAAEALVSTIQPAKVKLHVVTSERRLGRIIVICRFQRKSIRQKALPPNQSSSIIQPWKAHRDPFISQTFI